MARDAIAHEEEAPGDKVRMTFRVVLGRQDAEALAPRAILGGNPLPAGPDGLVNLVPVLGEAR
jgi:hypothetical protein